MQAMNEEILREARRLADGIFRLNTEAEAEGWLILTSDKDFG